jgi:hypothetical protein
LKKTELVEGEIGPNGKKIVKMHIPGEGDYLGETEAGLRDGFGHFEHKNKLMAYSGNFRNGIYDGLGILAYPNGDLYEGEFQNGLRHGKGTLHCAKESAVLHGEVFKNDMVCGLEGEYLSKKGTRSYKYKGEIYNGKPDGYGKFCN